METIWTFITEDRVNQGRKQKIIGITMAVKTI